MDGNVTKLYIAAIYNVKIIYQYHEILQKILQKSIQIQSTSNNVK